MFISLQLISFSHIYIHRRTGKHENLIYFQLQKNSPSPANEFILQTVGAIRK